jgi:acyl-coenzyme A synthetase/AMP-(fatty) acid ligase
VDETLHTALAVLRASPRTRSLHTGDLGRIDATGAVTVVDRLKEPIEVDGFQVAPAELEALLIEHPDVADAGVVGVPTSGTARCRWPSSSLPCRSARRRLPPGWPSGSRRYKRPRRIVTVDRLPRTPAGKLLRRELL